LPTVPGYVWGDSAGNPVSGMVFSGPEPRSDVTLAQAAAYGDLVQCVHCGGIYDMHTVHRTAFYPVYYWWLSPCCGHRVEDRLCSKHYRIVLLWPAAAGESSLDRA
jgi:hypothetical protein